MFGNWAVQKPNKNIEFGAKWLSMDCTTITRHFEFFQGLWTDGFEESSIFHDFILLSLASSVLHTQARKTLLV